MSTILTVTQVAQRLRRSVKTLQRWDRDGILTAQRTETNRRYYTEEQIRTFLNQPLLETGRKVIVYCRVSSQAQRPDLANQRATLEEFCTARGLANVEYVEEVGGGLNFKRKKFLAVFDRILTGEVGTLVIAHKDRLARFGFDLLAHLCQRSDCQLLVLNTETLSPEQEMVQDLLTITHCFSARLQGLRNYSKDLKKVLKK